MNIAEDLSSISEQEKALGFVYLYSAMVALSEYGSRTQKELRATNGQAINNKK